MLFNPFVVPRLSAFPLAGASVDLKFTTGQYYPSSISPDSASPNNLLSCSRASIGYAQTVAGTLTQFAANQLRITDQGLLIEDARTNTLKSSQAFTTADWNASNIFSRTDNSTSAPDGTTTAALIIPNNGSSSLTIYQVAVIGSGNVAFSIYCKAKEYGFAFLSAVDASTSNKYCIVVNLNTGVITDTNTVGTPAVVSSSVETLANGWYRLVVVLPGGSNYMQVGPCSTGTPSGYTGNLPDFTGDNASGGYLWGAQMEAGVFASSYIPTTTAAATRALDLVTTAGALDSTFRGAATSAVVDIKYITDASNLTFPRVLGAGTTGVATTPLFPNASNTIVGNYTDANGAISATLGAGSFSGGVKVGAGWTATTRTVVGGGGTVNSLAGQTVDLYADPLLVGQASGGANVSFAYFRRLTAWNSKLADATLQGFTSP